MLVGHRNYLNVVTNIIKMRLYLLDSIYQIVLHGAEPIAQSDEYDRGLSPV
jgi:hypothetical protein